MSNEKPKSCHDCKMLSNYSEGIGCIHWKDNAEAYIRRHPDCPMDNPIFTDKEVMNAIEYLKSKGYSAKQVINELEKAG